MGVQNFWQLIESTGRPVNMNKGLEGKVLAVDISIWLHQAAKGMRDRQNPHILLLLHRICKLLHFKIKPIFIFDGGVPELKRRTLAERRERREIAANKAKEASNKIRSNYLKMVAIQQLKGEKIESLPPPPVDDETERDLFELPENHLRAQLPEDDHVVDDDDNNNNDEDYIENNEFQPVRKVPRTRTTWSKQRTTDPSNYHYALPDVDEIDKGALDSLPIEMQYDILSEVKEKLKRGQHKITKMPQKSDDFSDYQVQKLLKQSAVSKKIFNLNKAIKRQKFDIPVNSDVRVYAGKLASDANTQYILIKPDTTPANPTQTSTTSTPSPALSRHNTSDFSADDLINRDPVTGLTQRKSVNLETNITSHPKILSTTPIRPAVNPVESESESDDEIEEIEKPSMNVPTTTSSILLFDQETSNDKPRNDEEERDLELAIQRSLEDRHTVSTAEPTASAETDSSDSDDADMIDVPIITKPREPIILPDFVVDEPPNLVDTSAESLNLGQEQNDESSTNSSAIEDIQAFLNEEKDLPSNTQTEVNAPSAAQLESLNEIQAEIISDTAQHMTTVRGNERLTTTLNDTMHEDTQYLLRLFGIPFLVSPTEAEAQCAYLDLTKQCDGVISDDSDVWLFGATRVYRHFFRQNQLVEYYDGNVIANQLGLDRESMIAVGMIVGSDYTKGIPNAGLMTALEILQEFHGTCMERLEKFRRWWRKAQRSDYKTESKVLKRLRNLQVFEGFPNQAVYDAYIHPKVDEDQSKFTWAMPQLELLREFIGSKLKWDRQRIDDMLLPVIKRMNSKEVQSRIDAFFAPLPFEGTGNQIRRNTRLKLALDLLKQKTKEAEENPERLDLSDDPDEDQAERLIPNKPISKKRKRTKNTKLMEDVLSVTEKTKLSTKARGKKKAAAAATTTSPILSDEDSS